MTPDEERIVYGALQCLMKHAPVLRTMAQHGKTDAEKLAYRHGVYAAAIKLQVALGTEVLEREGKRDAEREAQAVAYFATARAEKSTTPTGQEKT